MASSHARALPPWNPPKNRSALSNASDDERAPTASRPPHRHRLRLRLVYSAVRSPTRRNRSRREAVETVKHAMSRAAARRKEAGGQYETVRRLDLFRAGRSAALDDSGPHDGRERLSLGRHFE